MFLLCIYMNQLSSNTVTPLHLYRLCSQSVMLQHIHHFFFKIQGLLTSNTHNNKITQQTMPKPSVSQPDKINYYVKFFNFKLQKVLSHGYVGSCLKCGLVFLSPQASDYLYVLNTEFNLCMFKCLLYKSIYMNGLIFLQYFILFLQASKFLHDKKRR